MPADIQRVVPSNAFTIFCPSTVASRLIRLGRLAQIVIGMSLPFAATLPVIFTLVRARILSRPPFDLRFIAMISSSVWACAAPAARKIDCHKGGNQRVTTGA